MNEPGWHCPTCDYDLRGLPENRCPECGTPFDPIELSRAIGAQRKPIGPWTFVLLNAWPACAAVLVMNLPLPDRSKDTLIVILWITMLVNVEFTRALVFPQPKENTPRRRRSWKSKGLRTAQFVALLALQFTVSLLAVFVSNRLGTLLGSRPGGLP